RGTGYDLDLLPACSVSYSNFRPGSSTGVTAGIGNQSGEPVFADGDYRPAAGSPTIDAGRLDLADASTDPDGRPRMVGAAPDIGAYEYAPPPPDGTGTTADSELPDDLKGVPLPEQGRSMVVAAARGTVRVRVPGSDRFVALDEAGRVPVGSLIDARRGRVRLATAVDGGVQAGLFWGSRFKTGQSRHGKGMTTLSLRGGSVCPSASLATASRKGKRKRRRRLWARDHHGLYRTRGNDSVATVRGTRWLTKDRCNGTLTRVKHGVVSVRDLHRRKRVLVRAGHSYFARSR
ncbi:MAG TPA: choice-of-anchor Q domain-containing protein, partial [Solirubrobacteraceae bacterium]|nr:choice-of-anchor Q domain-containing protein [Solirubrobacteraceae bacterium]